MQEGGQGCEPIENPGEEMEEGEIPPADDERANASPSVVCLGRYGWGTVGLWSNGTCYSTVLLLFVRSNVVLTVFILVESPHEYSREK